MSLNVTTVYVIIYYYTHTITTCSIDIKIRPLCCLLRQWSYLRCLQLKNKIRSLYSRINYSISSNKTCGVYFRERDLFEMNSMRFNASKLKRFEACRKKKQIQLCMYLGNLISSLYDHLIRTKSAGIRTCKRKVQRITL